MTALPSFAHAQQGDSAAQASIKLQLERQRAPMFGGGRKLDVTALYSVSGTGCLTEVVIDYPATRAGDETYAAHTDRIVIPWSQAARVTTDGEYIVVAAPGLPEGGRYLYAGTPADAASLAAVMKQLAERCGSRLAAAPAPSAPKAAAAPSNTPCRFPAIPQLSLTGGTATWSAAPNERADDRTRLSFALQQSTEATANWRGLLLVSPRFTFRSNGYATRQIVRAKLLLDGKPVNNVAMRITQERIPALGEWSTVVTFAPATVSDEPAFLYALSRGALVSVRLADAGGPVATFTFPVTTVRDVPAALEASGWRCG
ncbi:hypothetical protein [Sphingomonas sp.]|uniref:hypothetical protein n=1 Tax=Sphingomonas sp. TaxID=28214 RepID=UPI001B2D554C|nr:hypothetical protein [Sphingomonas sp.]MBO9715065.1 hypothetical protein [Sphingomonas sp.]